MRECVCWVYMQSLIRLIKLRGERKRVNGDCAEAEGTFDVAVTIIRKEH